MDVKMKVSGDFFKGMFDNGSETKRERIFARVSKSELKRCLEIARQLNISKSELVRRGLSLIEERMRGEDD
jgi:DNA-binding CsgD family transcriptional regulator